MHPGKTELRRKIRRETAPAEDCLLLPGLAVLLWERWRAAKTVFVYRSLPGEASTAALIEDAQRSGKRLIVPGQAADAELVTPEGIDLAVVPGLAFDRRGYRLGRGGGYYDRYLASFAGVSVGLASRLMEEVPTEPHDRRVDFIAFGEELFNSCPRRGPCCGPVR